MIPAWWQTHTISVEPYQGGGAYGPIFGPAVTVACRVEDKVQLVRDNTGAEVVSSSTVWCDTSVVIPVGSRVTVKGRTTSVLSVSDPSTGWSGLDHQQVFLQ